MAEAVDNGGKCKEVALRTQDGAQLDEDRDNGLREAMEENEGDGEREREKE